MNVSKFNVENVVTSSSVEGKEVQDWDTTDAKKIQWSAVETNEVKWAF